MDTNSLMNRLMRVLRFDASVYREVAGDASALSQAIIVVSISAILSLIGSLLGVLFGGDLMTAILTALAVAVATYIGWALFSFIAAFAAQSLFQGKTNFQEMLRTVGFAYGWNVINVLSFIPVINLCLWIVPLVLVMISVVLALRESAEVDTTKAVIIAILAAVGAAAVNFCATALFGGSAALLLGLGQ